MVSRRDFLGFLGAPALLRRVGPSRAVPPSLQSDLPPADHPILSTLAPVITGARHVRLHRDRLQEVARWMAYEGLGQAPNDSPLFPRVDERDLTDFVFLTSTINFAFTDFSTHTMFRVSYSGREWSDSEAMVACWKRALDRGLPILEGAYLARLRREEAAEIFSGNIPIPMLEERLAIFHQVGRVLEERCGGRFHRFAEAGRRRLYSGGRGLLERLVGEFPSFQDASLHRGHRVVFHKRAQLLWWDLHQCGGTFTSASLPAGSSGWRTRSG